MVSKTVRNFGRIREAVKIPDLIELQRKGYTEFLQIDVAPNQRKNTGLEALFREIFPVESYDKSMLMEYRQLLRWKMPVILLMNAGSCG